MFIYKITNTINGKIYIGFDSKNILLNSRWKYHLKSYNYTPKQYKTGCYLYNAMRKYGIEKFHYEIIDTSAKSREELGRLEKKYIKIYNSHFKIGHGYNMTFGGDGFDKEYWENKKKFEPEYMLAWAKKSSENSKKKWADPIFRKQNISATKKAQLERREYYSMKSLEQHQNMSIEEKQKRSKKISYSNSPMYKFENLETNEIIITNNLTLFVKEMKTKKDVILRKIKEQKLFRKIWIVNILYPKGEALLHLDEINWGRD